LGQLFSSPNKNSFDATDFVTFSNLPSGWVAGWSAARVSKSMLANNSFYKVFGFLVLKNLRK
jgi:hypothetical protein